MQIYEALFRLINYHKHVLSYVSEKITIKQEVVSDLCPDKGPTTTILDQVRLMRTITALQGLFNLVQGRDGQH